MKQILKTIEYDKFKFITENRSIDENQVKKLINVISQNDKSELHPILVNKNFEIIDGQHRFTALQKLKKPIYYVMDENFNLSDIHIINTIAKNWTAEQFLEYYVKQGLRNYIYFKEIKERYVLNHTATLILLSKEKDFVQNNLSTQFSSGKLELKPLVDIEFFIPVVLELKDLYSTINRNLLRSFFKLYYYEKEVDILKLIEKLKLEKEKNNNDKLIPRFNLFDNMRYLEDVYNYKLRKQVYFANRYKRVK